MDINKLKHFISAAELLNFTRAAKENYVTQPTLSRNVADLEREYGTELFIRDKRSLRLTESGKCLYGYACRIIRQYEESKKKIAYINGGLIGTLRFGYSNGSPLHIFSQANMKMNEEDRKIDISTYQKNMLELIEDLHNETADMICIMAGDLNDLKYKEEVETIDLPKSFKIILPYTHTYSNRKGIDLNELSGENFIIFDREAAPYIYNYLEKISNKYGFVIKKLPKKAFLEDVVLAVGSGEGFSIVTDVGSKMDTLFVNSLEITNEDFNLRWILAWKRNNRNPCIKLLCDMIKKITDI